MDIPEYLYRLLRPGEDINHGLRAKNPNSKISVFRHVTKGSQGQKSKFISTCASLEAIEEFASSSRETAPIIRIDTTELPDNVDIIVLREQNDRNGYIKSRYDADDVRKFNTFTTKFEEVLLVGFIPSQCLETVEGNVEIPKYLYRLLRYDEDINEGLEAKDPFSTISVFYHVIRGSRGQKSKFISSCASLEAAEDFASKSRTGGTIVRIDTTELPDDVDIMDLREQDDRDRYIFGNFIFNNDDIRKFNNFARKFEEVLLIGFIPSECLEIEREF